jgi:hypothetical protein
MANWQSIYSVALLCLLMSACTPPPPVTLSNQFTPPSSAAWRENARAQSAQSATVCNVQLAGVRDLRNDPESMGAVGGQIFHQADAAAWIRSGIEALSRDPRIKFINNISPSTLVMDVELLKAYAAAGAGATHITNVVLRVRYSRAGSQIDDRIYRGDDNGTTWLSAGRETQSSFNWALSNALRQVNADIIARCGS